MLASKISVAGRLNLQGHVKTILQQRKPLIVVIAASAIVVDSEVRDFCDESRARDDDCDGDPFVVAMSN